MTISYTDLSARLAKALEDALYSESFDSDNAKKVLVDYYEYHNKNSTVNPADYPDDIYGIQPYVKDEEYANESDKLIG